MQVARHDVLPREASTAEVGADDPGWRNKTARGENSVSTTSVKRPYPRHPTCAIECRCDGDQVYAMIGPNMMEGVIGFGDTLPDALRALADELEREVGQEPERK